MPQLIVLIALLSFAACQNPSLPASDNKATTPTEKPSPKPSESTAVRLANEQLAAYNNRDIEAFLRPYSDSVKVYSDLKTFGYEGIDKMREGYVGWFSGLDTLHCEIINRIATGNTVIDHEKLYFQFPGQEPQQGEAIAIYKVEHDKIQEVFFVQPKWDSE